MVELDEFLRSGWGALAIALAGAFIGGAATFVFGWLIFRKQRAHAQALAAEQIEAARVLATEQGAFRTPKLYGYLIHPKLAEQIILAVDFSGKRPFIINLPIMVENRGDRSAKGVSIILRLPRVVGNFAAVKVDEKTATFPGVNMSVLGEIDGTTVIAFSIPSLPVGHPLRLMLPVTFPAESFFEFATRPKTLDRVRLSLKSAVRFSYPFSLMISDEDGETYSRSYRYELVRGQAKEVRAYAQRVGQAKVQIATDASRNDTENATTAVKTTVSAAILTEHSRIRGPRGMKSENGYDQFGFEGAWLVGGFETDNAMWFPPLDDGATGPPTITRIGGIKLAGDQP